MSDRPIKLLIDGDCPLCRREAAVIRRLDRGRGRIDLVNIADPAFDPGALGLTTEAVNARMHAVLPGGQVVTGMEAFRRVYSALGRGWLLAPTGWPILRPIFDRLYTCFARNRHRLTGRSRCADGRCAPRSAVE